ncbi:hypothetical protein [Pandoraea sputorum]|uniref:hypothetical protein n=1 Tax=Pandoraea sputorum TaxID=93222 RepID=UPI00123F4CA8|nr:hypothetical protein [Pandoraea sputorum]VVE55394.1 hypothetical protein PSP20601_04983 [Pandoraea sputorum]
MGTPPINTTKPSFSTNTVAGKDTTLHRVLGHRVNLDQVKDINKICENVATRYLQPSNGASGGHPAITLSIGGTLYTAALGAASHVPADPHQLRRLGLDLLQEVANQIFTAFTAAGVPEAVANELAETIAAQLGRDCVTADEELYAALEEQQKYQQHIDVSIAGDKVSFRKTTTLVAALAPAVSSEVASAVSPELTSAAKDEPDVSLTGVMEVTTEFSAKRGDSWLRSTAAKWFGGEQTWVLEARVALVEQRRLGAPPAPSTWTEVLAQFFRTLGEILGRQGIVFNQRDSGPRAAGESLSHAPLDGIERFERDQFAAVSARQSRGGWNNATAKYRLLRSGAVTQDGTRLFISQQVGNAKYERAAERARLERAAQIGRQYLATYNDTGRLKDKRSFSEIARAYAEQGARHYVRAPAAEVLANVFRDLGRNQFKHGLNYIMLGGRAILSEKYHQANTQLEDWKRARKESADAGLASPPMPQTLWELLDGLKVPITTPDEMTAALARKASEAAIDAIRAAFPNDPIMQHNVLVVLTQGFDITMIGAIQIDGCPSFGSSDAVLQTSIEVVSTEEGERHARVTYVNRTRDPDKPEPAVQMGEHTLVAEPFTYNNRVVSATWSVTPAGYKLTKSSFEVELVRNPDYVVPFTSNLGAVSPEGS